MVNCIKVYFLGYVECSSLLILEEGYKRCYNQAILVAFFMEKSTKCPHIEHLDIFDFCFVERLVFMCLTGFCSTYRCVLVCCRFTSDLTGWPPVYTDKDLPLMGL